ncbi:MAG: two pore domain potassium channel family protein [Rhodospirillales bacterium]|nr:two pore domain potassium channel family protein [Rhodospirillales bacterium]MCB9996785.1 two pore domain potassium channel family protein [Rhodospirillales bacterium]
MILQLLIGTVMIVLNVVLQALGLDYVIRKVQWLEKTSIRGFKKLWKSIILAIVVLAVAAIMTVEIWIWAMFYLLVGALPDIESALYFSVSTFTTVGYGDVILGTDWRLLSSIEATCGFLMFGWSAAFIFEVVTRVYRKEGKAIQD